MSPTRRSLLTSGGALALGALAGCTSPSGGSNGDGGALPDGGDDSDDGDTNDTRPEGTGGPGVSLRGTDDAPDLPVRPAVEITEDTATDDHPPQLRLTVTNESNGTVAVGEGRAIVFAYVHDTSGDLVLLPVGGDYPAEAGCWRLEEGILTTEEYRTVELEAGESVSAPVDLYGAAGGEGCLPVGEFRFESRYSVTRNTDELPTDGESAAWGFSLALE